MSTKPTQKSSEPAKTQKKETTKAPKAPENWKKKHDRDEKNKSLRIKSREERKKRNVERKA